MLACMHPNLAFHTKIIGLQPTAMYYFGIERVMKNQTWSTTSIEEIAMFFEIVIGLYS
jgi:hypothetical protein